MPGIASVLAQNLKRLRELRQLSQKELADKAGTNVQNIKRWETQRSWPGLDAIEKLAKALGVQESDLFYPGELPKPIVLDPTPRRALEILRDELMRLSKDAGLKWPLESLDLDETLGPKKKKT